MKAKRVLAPGTGRRRFLAGLGRAAPEEGLSNPQPAFRCGFFFRRSPLPPLLDSSPPCLPVRLFWSFMSLIVTFGETMLRLAPPGFERFLQSPQFVATFGGGEANVAVAVAQFGLPARYVTVLPPNNPIADGLIGELRRFGVDTSRIVRGKGRMGIYFVEPGANQRASKVVYDRENSAIALAQPGDIEWKQAFEGATWYHITGITPAISRSAADLSLESLKAARAIGLKISCDLNYRKNLWKYGVAAKEVMSELVRYVDVGIANEEDCQAALGIEIDVDVHAGRLDTGAYRRLAEKAVQD